MSLTIRPAGPTDQDTRLALLRQLQGTERGMDSSRLPGAAVTDACHAKLVGQLAGIPFGVSGHRAIGFRRQQPASHPWQRRDSRAKSSTMGAAGSSIIAALLSAYVATTATAVEDRIPNSDAAAFSRRSITARRSAGDRAMRKAPEAAPWLRRGLPAHLGALVHRVRQETVTPLPEPNLRTTTDKPVQRGRHPECPRRADRAGQELGADAGQAHAWPGRVGCGHQKGARTTARGSDRRPLGENLRPLETVLVRFSASRARLS